MSIPTELQRRLARHATRVLVRPAENIPQGGKKSLFIVTGRIVMVALFAEVTTVIGAGANAFHFDWNPDTGVDEPLSVAPGLDIDAAAVGSVLHMRGGVGGPLVNTNQAGVYKQGFTVGTQAILTGPGIIDATCAASSTGQMKYYLEYRPFDADGGVVLA